MAVTKLTQIMKQRQTLSFELFPPKTPKGMANLEETLNRLNVFKPDYMSVTYGAGGANVGTNRVVCQMIADHGVVPVTHFNLIRHTRESIKEQLDQYLEEGEAFLTRSRKEILRALSPRRPQATAAL